MTTAILPSTAQAYTCYILAHTVGVVKTCNKHGSCPNRDARVYRTREQAALRLSAFVIWPLAVGGSTQTTSPLTTCCPSPNKAHIILNCSVVDCPSADFLVTVMTSSSGFAISWMSRENTALHASKGQFEELPQVQVQVFTQRPRNGRIKLCNCANREVQLSNLCNN
jgi:hypothetical protein